MSFILDALRKSEAERQRQAGPALMDPGQRPPARQRTLWVPLLVIVLLANLAYMALYWRDRAPASPPPAEAVAREPGGTPPAAVGQPLAALAGVSSVEDAPYAATADLPAIEPDAEPFTETLVPPPQELANGGTVPVISEGLPTAAQLVANGSLEMPALHLDIHVFSSDPAERFVFINMRKYAEGMQLPEGPRLEEITPEGAVFSHNGQRFLLARD